MPGITENNFILARSQEHKLILETLGDMEACLKFSTAAEMIENLKGIIDTFQTNLTRHQLLEEKVIFAAGLRLMPTAGVIETITQLIKEHGAFEAFISSIKDKLYHPGDEKKTRILVQREMERMILQIKKHSLLEVKNLFPILSNNPRCRTLIDSLAEKEQIK